MSEIFNRKLIGRRDRESSHTRHWRDAEVRRVRLYNASWRYLGEQLPHGLAPAPSNPGAAGTFFRDPHNWRTFDHVLVSCGLLGASPPYLDEARTRVTPLRIMLDENGLPRPFDPATGRGISNHLPIVGHLVLSKGIS
jgi:hypothetical protein